MRTGAVFKITINSFDVIENLILNLKAEREVKLEFNCYFVCVAGCDLLVIAKFLVILLRKKTERNTRNQKQYLTSRLGGKSHSNNNIIGLTVKFVNMQTRKGANSWTGVHG